MPAAILTQSCAVLAALVLTVATVLSGCSEPRQWRTSNITGKFPDLQFELTSEQGETVTSSGFPGHDQPALLRLHVVSRCLSDDPVAPEPRAGPARAR
ncbi:MAG: hypothetical protein U5K43_07135 [Halofilum sp. (in: g-proteobacteria)]|nr:hypothetical protein [Halofilum sp. (in: g-proteobacteria)]